MLSRSCPDNPVLSTMTANKPLSLAATAALEGTACPQVDAEVCAKAPGERCGPGAARTWFVRALSGGSDQVTPPPG